jgi:HSP20 family protein
MALIRRRDELDWPELFGRRFSDWPDLWPKLMEGSGVRLEEYEQDGHLVVRAEMPGIDPDKDVEITVEDRVLRIRAERRQETKTEDKKGFRSEFHYGSFVRQVPLPAGASEKDVSATYTDGILEVRVPVDGEAAEAKKVPISRR